MCPVSSRRRHNSGALPLVPGNHLWLVSFVSERSPVLLGKNAYFARYPMLGTVPGKKCRKSAWRMELKIKFTL